VAEIEPFTGIGKVETQNRVETYQFKLEDLKVTDFAVEAEASQHLDTQDQAKKRLRIDKRNKCPHCQAIIRSSYTL